MRLDITDRHFIELHKKGYSVDMVLMLSWINKNLAIDHIIKGSKKIEALRNTLYRKGLITEENEITLIGIEILNFIAKKTNKKFDKPKVTSSEFDKWWSLFPSTDAFAVQGKRFKVSRAFKVKKEGCRVLFNTIILAGLYTSEEIIKATEFDINLRKNQSYIKKQNQLTYLRNSHTYLLNKDFEGFVGMVPEKVKKINKSGAIDI